HAEAEAACRVLGADLVTFDADDYPLVESPDLLHRLVGVSRDTRPTVVVTHTERDPRNRDHDTAHALPTKARALARAAGRDPEAPRGTETTRPPTPWPPRPAFSPRPPATTRRPR